MLEIQEHLQNKAGSCKARETNDIAKAEEFGVIIYLIIDLIIPSEWMKGQSPDLEGKKKKDESVINGLFPRV